MAGQPNIYLQDSNGQWYQLVVDSHGDIQTVTVTTPNPTPTYPLPQCTITLADTIEWAKRLNFGRNAVLGTNSEPALTSANIIKQVILGAPFEWRWNRKEYTWTTVAPNTNWQANHVYMVGDRIIDSNGNLQTVISSPSSGIAVWTPSTHVNIGQLMQPTEGMATGYFYECVTAGTTDITESGWTTNPFLTSFQGTAEFGFNLSNLTGKSGAVQPPWSTDVVNNGVTVDGTLQWQVSDPQTYIEFIPDFGWIEHASIKDIKQNPAKWIEIQPKLSLSLDSSLARPRFISAHTDDNEGNIGFVLTPVPDAAYPVNLHIQKRAPLFTSTGDSWAPIPDEFSYIYNWGFLALMFMFADDPRFSVANQKFVASLLASNEGLTETERDMFLTNWGNITSAQTMRETQGGQARGI